MDFLAAAGGAAAGLGWLPLGMAPFLPLAFVLAMLGIRQARTPGDAVRFGLVHGAVRYAVAAHFLLALLSWSSLGFVVYLMAIVFILPYALVESLGAYWLEERTGVPRTLLFGLLYALMEKVRTLGDLSFPADLLSHAFGTNPAWLAWEPWIGPFGQTMLIMVTAWLLVTAWEKRRDRRSAALAAAAAAVIWLGPPLTDAAGSVPESAGPGLRVAIVQPAVTLDDKLKKDRWPAVRAKLEGMTFEAARDSDLVVWPESARAGPLIWDEASPFADPPMEALATRAGVPILYGCEIARFRGGKIAALYNGAALVRPGGGNAQWYAKQHLLPLIEGVPFGSLVGWDPAKRHRETGRHGYLTLMGNFDAGAEPTLFEVGPARIGVLICYEGFYPGLARRYRDSGANALAVLTNDAWWGRSVFARWHAGMVSSRAREIGVPVIRAANSGVSSSLDAAGRTHGATGLFEVTTFRTVLRPASAKPTFYSSVGDWPVWLAVAFIAGALLSRRVASRGVARGRGGSSLR